MTTLHFPVKNQNNDWESKLFLHGLNTGKSGVAASSNQACSSTCLCVGGMFGFTPNDLMQISVHCVIM
jgi:hypothetical protein